MNISPEVIIWLFLFGVYIIILAILRLTYPKKFKIEDKDKKTLFSKINMIGGVSVATYPVENWGFREL